jgi:hypothetical protein
VQNDLVLKPLVGEIALQMFEISRGFYLHTCSLTSQYFYLNSSGQLVSAFSDDNIRKKNYSMSN